jgi:hypothetical protein
VHLARDSHLGELLDCLLPAVGADAGRHAVQAAEGPGVGTYVQAGGSQKGDQLPLPMSKKKCDETG